MTKLAQQEIARDGEPREQEILALHLSERVRSMLAGDADERRRIEQRRPSKVLQLGVLPPQARPDGIHSPEELARRRGEPPSTMGLDFLYEPSGDGATVEVEASFSIYVQRYPTYEEQRAWWQPGAGGEDDEDGGDDPGRVRLKGIYERFDVSTGRLRVEIDPKAAPDRAELALDDAIARALGDALTEQQTVYPFERSQTLPADALDSSQAWQHAILEAEGDARTRPLSPPDAAIVVGWRRAGDGLHIYATLVNRSLAPARGRERERGAPRELPRDLHLFNCQLRVFEIDGGFVQTRFAQAPEDFRYAHLRWVWATGQNCVGRRLTVDEEPERPLATETWPLYRQRRMLPRADRRLELTFAELSNRDTYLAALTRVRAEMTRFEGEWRQALAQWPSDATRQACERALQRYQVDISGFDRGLRCLAEDPLLERAFVETNEVFRRQGQARRQPIEKWRLFQIVYQVIELAALRARESNAPELLVELDTVTVLWFPTGGGKTEAYLGLITCALFYDRLRGKERGVASILRFPLRMLSVQQLQRVLAVVWVAERRRREILSAEGVMEGDSFALGYWVGSDNSPNSLTGPREWRRESIEWWERFIAEQPAEALKERIITRCPNPECDGGAVELEADVQAVRLRHVCRTCGEELPVYISDDEVYRYLPAVLVCTVDKLANIARAEHFTHVVAGPAYRCPEHGYFTWHQPVWDGGATPSRDDRCLAGRFCAVDATAYEQIPASRDPGPSLQVQDELHLLEEELGTFNAHYETLMELLGRSFGGRKPAKLLAATATIEAFDEQVRQLYARRARVFPSPGWELDRSFYTVTTDDARRLYIGALPYRPDAAEFGEKVQELLHLELAGMQDDPSGGLRRLGLEGRDERWLEEQLFMYELALGYVNRKQDADRIQWLLKGLARREGLADDLDVVVLTGANSLAEIADVLERIETETPASTSRAERLRALVATSIVSHGVDIDRLNLMVMNGMTPAVADYIQASSRSGRTHIGLVIVGFDRRRERDVSFYRYFLSYHAFIDRLIAPVPVNRFAKFAVRRTMPGLLSTLLVLGYGRERLDRAGRNPARPLVKSLSIASELRRWWRSADPPNDKRNDLSRRALAALGLDKRVLEPDADGGFHEQAVFDPGMVDSLRDDAVTELDAQIDIMQDFNQSGRTWKLFRPEPLTSFREVDEPIEFAVARGEASHIEVDLQDVRASRGGST